MSDSDRHPDGIGLEEMARSVTSPKATAHRALAALPGVHCVAVAAFLTSPSMPSGAISITGLAYRTSLRTLIDDLPGIRAIVDGANPS
ncbi:hypothetical protein SMD20_44885 [Nonomuraea sp. LP-02]|uniref:hypothetical protein n=1 Tax=Nonomuraea sp. LP-02 TaxID=3097960 RepID=UPI002E2EFFF2|nr:hypothetical protein [Nonomuraea sp. LP-02]MED7931423.1 hypothetical protein [Nonomuraea sp. LP-02]